MSDAVYCKVCNYAISKTQRDSMNFDLPCPSCWTGKISDFYSIGSMTHRQILSGDYPKQPRGGFLVPGLPKEKEGGEK